MNDVLRQLEGLRDMKPRKEWVESNRSILLSQIRGQEAVKNIFSGVRYWDVLKVVFGYKILVPIVRPVSIAILAIIVVLTGGVVGVRAARESMPGDLLYPIKLTSENLQVGLTNAPEKKAELYLSFAEERVSEIQKVKTTSASSRAEKIGSAATSLKSNLKKANEQLSAVKNNTPEKAVELAKSVNAKIEIISGKLAEVEKDLKVNNESVVEVNSAQSVARNAEISAVEVIIEKQGTANVAGAELKSIVGNKINNVAQDIKDTQINVDNAVEVLIEKNDNGETTQAGITQAEQKLREANTLLDEGDLGSAIDKMKESAGITQGVQARLDATKPVIVDVLVK